jgi:alkanesulfonate monooxygenase SsuD/methylene tetrahydromethanopterin reductase-like flavin-dependent oxidoreductase (luciferase family)
MPHLEATYDMRIAPWSDVPRAELYATMVEQARWIDAHNFAALRLGEHHLADDGYLTSPLTLLGAVAAVTKRIILTPCLLAPLYDPIRLAEDIAVVDLVSAGRISPLILGGYRSVEFNLFGYETKDRRRLMEHAVDILKKAWSGESFEYRGKPVTVLPTPHQRPRPPLFVGAVGPKMARRCAHIGDAFYPGEAIVWEEYRSECLAIGRPDPGPFPKHGPTILFVSEDPERAWHTIGRHFIHTGNTYSRWMNEEWGRNSEEFPSYDMESVKAAGSQYTIMTPEQAIELGNSLGRDGILRLWPQLAGLDSETSWEALELFTSKVVPYLDVPTKPGVMCWTEDRYDGPAN